MARGAGGAREAGALGRERPVGIGEGEPMDDQHAEGALFGEWPDGPAGMEAAQLESRLEEKAVAGSRSGEQGDALVRRVLAFQEEKRIGVSPPGKLVEGSGPGQPGSI